MSPPQFLGSSRSSGTHPSRAQRGNLGLNNPQNPQTCPQFTNPTLAAQLGRDSPPARSNKKPETSMEEEGLSPVMKRGGGFMRLEGVCAVLRPREDDGGALPLPPLRWGGSKARGLIGSFPKRGRPMAARHFDPPPNFQRHQRGALRAGGRIPFTAPWWSSG